MWPAVSSTMIPGSISAPGLNMPTFSLMAGELGLRGFHHAFHVLGHFAGEVWRGPEIPFGFGHVERGVGEDRLAIGAEGAPEMIGVGVGEDNFGDGACIGARGFEAFGEFCRQWAGSRRRSPCP